MAYVGRRCRSGVFCTRLYKSMLTAACLPSLWQLVFLELSEGAAEKAPHVFTKVICGTFCAIANLCLDQVWLRRTTALYRQRHGAVVDAA
ncbi:hypothetical protein MRX96_035263 [Rhipicephalus microplus]